MAPVTDNSECLEIASVKQAISAVFQILVKRRSENGLGKKRRLLDDNMHEKIKLSLVLKKIPHIRCRKVIRITLPHPITLEVARICLLVKDLKLKKKDIEETKLHYKELLASKGIDFISEVLPLHQLRTEYSTFESKRKLCQSYDLFIADRDIECFLPWMLGKEFLLKKKLPAKVNMKGNKLKEKLEEIRDSTYLYLHEQGPHYEMYVGLTTQLEKHVEANILACTNMLKRFLPGSWRNIRELNVKGMDTMAIPFYVSFGSAENVVLKAPYRTPNTPVIDEVTTVETGFVAVFPNGDVRTVQELKREPYVFRKAKQMQEGEGAQLKSWNSVC